MTGLFTWPAISAMSLLALATGCGLVGPGVETGLVASRSSHQRALSPLRAALYLPPEVASANRAWTISYPDRPRSVTIPLYRPFVADLERLLREQFPHLQVTTREPAPRAYDLVFVPAIEPHLEASGYGAGGTLALHVAVRLKVQEASGGTVDSLRAQGRGQASVENFQMWRAEGWTVAGPGGEFLNLAHLGDTIGTAALTSAMTELQISLSASARLREYVEVAEQLKQWRSAHDRLSEGERKLHHPIDRLVAQVMSRVPASRRLTITVAPFTQASSRRGDLERYVEAEFAQELSRRRPHRIVERAAIEEVFSELGRIAKEPSNVEGARKLGRLVGADAVLAGMSIEQDPWVTITARLIETETGRNLGTAAARVFNAIKYARLEQRLIALSSPGPSAGSQ